MKQRFGEAARTKPELRKTLVMTLAVKCNALDELKRWEESIGVCDELERGYGEVPINDTQLREALKDALGYKCRALISLEKWEDAIRFSNEMENRYGRMTESSTQLQELRGAIAFGLLIKAGGLFALNRFNESVEQYHNLELRFPGFIDKMLGYERGSFRSGAAWNGPPL